MAPKTLDLFAFYDMFASARSFAFVGNAGSILEYENGDLIDSHDVVVRFNRAATAGIEGKVGRRTDILCANISNIPGKAPSPAETLNPRCVVHFSTKSPKDPEQCQADAFRAWVGDLPLLITFAPDPIGTPAVHRTRQLTHGTYALFGFLQLFRIEKLFLTGFTMFTPVAGTLLKQYEAPRHRIGLKHDLDAEAVIFCDILRRFQGELAMTPEVQGLVDRHGGLGRDAVRVAGGTRASLYERAVEKLAWHSMRVGFKLRRHLEQRAALSPQRPKD